MTLPETPKRAQQELTLQTTLGPALMAVKGQGAPEVEHTYARARELCQEVGETAQHFPALFGLWRFYFVRATYATARELGEQCLNLAQQADDPALLLGAHFALGGTLLYTGELISARDHVEQGIELYDVQAHRSLAFRYGIDPGVWCVSYAGHILCLLGYPEQALKRNYEALALARELSHPLTLAACLNYAASTHYFRREWSAAQDQAEAAEALANEQMFPQWQAMGMFMQGFALEAQGQTDEGISMLLQGISKWQDIGQEIGMPYLLCWMAETHGRSGQPEEGLRVLDDAFGRIERTGGRKLEPELHRVKGELLLTLPGNHDTAVASCFQLALEVARHQQAKWLELRAAMSLSRLWQRQGKQDEARQLLTDVYGWFTEGFDTTDLQQAKALLEALT
jgi:adenylate cyclase